MYLTMITKHNLTIFCYANDYKIYKTYYCVIYTIVITREENALLEEHKRIYEKKPSEDDFKIINTLIYERTMAILSRIPSSRTSEIISINTIITTISGLRYTTTTNTTTNSTTLNIRTN